MYFSYEEVTVTLENSIFCETFINPQLTGKTQSLYIRIVS